MKAKSKRIMGLFLALVMLIGCLPFNIIETYAETGRKVYKYRPTNLDNPVDISDANIPDECRINGKLDTTKYSIISFKLPELSRYICMAKLIKVPGQTNKYKYEYENGAFPDKCFNVTTSFIIPKRMLWRDFRSDLGYDYENSPVAMYSIIRSMTGQGCQFEFYGFKNGLPNDDDVLNNGRIFEADFRLKEKITLSRSNSSEIDNYIWTQEGIFHAPVNLGYGRIKGHGNGGTINGKTEREVYANVAYDLTFAEVIKHLPDPYKEGYKFKYWSESPEEGSPAIDGTKVYNEKTSSSTQGYGIDVYAQYEQGTPDIIENPTKPTPQGYARVTFRAGEGIEKLNSTKSYDVKIGTSLREAYYPEVTLKATHENPVWSVTPGTPINSTVEIVATASSKGLIKIGTDPSTTVPVGYTRIIFDATVDGNIAGNRYKVIDVLNGTTWDNAAVTGQVPASAKYKDTTKEFKEWDSTVPIGGEVQEQDFVAIYKPVLNTKALEDKIAEAKEVLKNDNTSDPAKALDAKVKEAEALIGTATEQSQVDEKVTELDTAIAAVKELADAKAKAKKEIGDLPNLSEEEKAPFITQVDDAKTKGEVTKAVEDAKNADDLKAYKEKAKEDIGKLPNLSDTEKDTYKDEVDKATDKPGVNEVVAEAKAKDTENKELKEAKDKAKEDIKDLNLTPEEKAAAEKAIDDAKDKAEVDQAVADAKDKAAANDQKDKELKEAKDKAKEDIKDLNLTPEEKAAAEKAIDEAKDKDGVDKAVADAKDKAAANDQKDKELKDEKDAAKEEIDKLPNLSNDEKKEAKDKVDEAKDKTGVEKAVEDAKAKDEEKASDPADKAKEEAEEAKKAAEEAKAEAEKKAKEAEEKAKEAEKKAEEAAEKAKEAEEKAKEAEEKAKEAEEKAKEAEKAAEEAKEAKEASEADPNNTELAEKAKEAEEKAKEAEKKAEEAAKAAEEAKKAAEEAKAEAEKKAEEAAKAAEEAKEAKEAADNAQKEADKKAKEAEEKEKALPATPDDKNKAKEEIGKLPNLSDTEKDKYKKQVDDAKTKGEVEKVVEAAKEKSAGGQTPPTPTPTPTPNPDGDRDRDYWHRSYWTYSYGPSSTTKVTVAKSNLVKLEAKLVIGSKELIKSVDGVEQKVFMDIAPFIEKDRTMLPIRFVAEALGFNVQWDNENRTVILIDKENVVKIPVDTNQIIVNGKVYESDVKPVIRNDRTMLPIANIARALGLKDG
ncbi:stalk domain-containing protein, partial [Peptoniphilus raoultii]|uniref:stalk domain-containing protein n=1 Tax=Peptoniphilus raoultii TaxID=1776387 RepID=UPI000A4698DE